MTSWVIDFVSRLPRPSQPRQLGSLGSFLSSLMCLATTKKCFKTTLLKSEASNDLTDIDQSQTRSIQHSQNILWRSVISRPQTTDIGRAEIVSITVRARNTCLYVGSISWQKVRRLFRVNFTGCELLNEDLRCPGPGAGGHWCHGVRGSGETLRWHTDRGLIAETEEQSSLPLHTRSRWTWEAGRDENEDEFFLLFASGGRNISEKGKDIRGGISLILITSAPPNNPRQSLIISKWISWLRSHNSEAHSRPSGLIRIMASSEIRFYFYWDGKLLEESQMGSVISQIRPHLL